EDLRTQLKAAHEKIDQLSKKESLRDSRRSGRNFKRNSTRYSSPHRTKSYRCPGMTCPSYYRIRPTEIAVFLQSVQDFQYPRQTTSIGDTIPSQRISDAPRRRGRK